MEDLFISVADSVNNVLISCLTDNFLVMLSNSKKVFWISMFITFLEAILIFTVISRPVSYHMKYRLVPMWSYLQAFKIKKRRLGLILSNISNCIMFVTLGFCLRNIDNHFTIMRASFVGIIISYGIEIIQLFTKRGIFELFDDPIHNSIGMVIGYTLIMNIILEIKVIDKEK